MARMPGAQWRPLSINHTQGGCSPRLVILHIIVGTLSGADSWFRNRASRVSAHFGTSRAGALRQWVDSGSRAWANAGANGYAISVENEGNVGDSLTDAQLDRCAEVLAWAHREHGVALAVTDNPDGSGLAYHNLSPAWSLGGTACPGPRIVAQRAEIVRRATAIATGNPITEEEDDMGAYVSVNKTSKSRQERLKSHEWATVYFNHNNSAAADDHHDPKGDFPSLVNGPKANGGCDVNGYVSLRLSDIPKGTECQARAIEVRKQSDGSYATVDRDDPVEFSGTGGDTFVHIPVAGYVPDGDKLRVEVTHFGGDQVDDDPELDPRVIAGKARLFVRVR
ncbi:N-acetylmuramoyl-L-alanine amidase [Nocardiopsis alba]|uniref:N-acetylmuramoyl-L-alanine amidase n=1 Tax=Nocardiopsis alba TaxID=53437 RepID=UPI0035E07BF9